MLGGDEGRCRRVSLFDLIAARMETIGQVESSADRRHPVDQRLGGLHHVDLAFRRDLLGKRHDSGNPAHRRDRKHRRLVLGDIAQGHVQEFGPRLRYDVPAGDEEFAEPLRRDEIFVQDVGPARVFLSKVDDRLGHQRVARRASP